MREDFERKLTKNEFDNLMLRLEGHFKPKSVLEIFEYFMENGSYTWTQGRFTNKIGLLYKTHADIMLHKANNKPEDLQKLKDMINKEQGEDKHYFLYFNYHKCSQMWRLEDDQCIWGVGVHESYKPLQYEYFRRLKEIREKEKLERDKKNINELLSKYVEEEKICKDFYGEQLKIGDNVIPICSETVICGVKGKITEIYYDDNYEWIDICNKETDEIYKKWNALYFSTQKRYDVLG